MRFDPEAVFERILVALRCHNSSDLLRARARLGRGFLASTRRQNDPTFCRLSEPLLLFASFALPFNELLIVLLLPESSLLSYDLWVVFFFDQ
jgi:hypothetical protein